VGKNRHEYLGFELPKAACRACEAGGFAENGGRHLRRKKILGLIMLEISLKIFGKIPKNFEKKIVGA
jgi:hypothetical protein